MLSGLIGFQVAQRFDCYPGNIVRVKSMEDTEKESFRNALFAQSLVCINPVCTKPTFFQEIECLQVLLRKLRLEFLWDLDKQVKRLEDLVTDFTTC